MLVIIIPTYNEAENLPLMLAALFELGLEEMQVLVVDDNSPDGTGELAEQLSERYNGRVQVLHRPQKSGLGPAYIAGFKHALTHMNADLVIQMDADFSHQPHYIPQMLAELGDYDAVIGSRWVRGGGVDEGWGWLRKLLSMWANRIYTPLILGVPIHDSTGGYRLWRRETLIGMNLDSIVSNGYVFQVELVYVAHRLGYRLKEIPIYFPDRTRGHSKMKPTIAIEAALRTWQIRFRNRHLKPSLRRTQEYA